MTRARACVVRRLNVFECVRMMTRMFVPCMLGCSAADALVVATACRWNIRVHFVVAVFARGAKKMSLYDICIMYWGQDYKRFSSMSRCSTHNLCSEMT